MYNQSFEDLKPALRDNLKAAKFPPYKIDTFVSRLSILVSSETQKFDKSFANISNILNRMKNSKKGMTSEEAIETLLKEPQTLFEMNDMPYVKDTRAPSQTNIRTLSPYLALQISRRRHQPGERLSKNTIETLAVPPLDKIDVGTPRVREYGPTDEDTQQPPRAKEAADSVVVSTVSSPATEFKGAADPDTIVEPQNTTSEVSLKSRIIPPYEVIAAAAWSYKSKHGKTPYGVGGREFLPENSKSWSTLTIHHLKGENTLPNLMKKYPEGYSASQPATTSETNTVVELTGLLALKTENPPETLRASFNPLSTDTIQPDDVEISHLNPHHLAMLAAIKQGCKKQDLLSQANAIYQETGKIVLTTMFPGVNVTAEDFSSRDQEFQLKLREELLEIVVAENDERVFGLG